MFLETQNELPLFTSKVEIRKFLKAQVNEEILNADELTAVSLCLLDVAPISKTKMEQIVDRLNSGEPIQYILEQAYFYNHFFKVNKHTLIPRPETEELVDLILKAYPADSELLGLDIGTGSGCIAVSLLDQRPKWRFIALDISEEALKIAEHNAQKIGVLNRIELKRMDILNESLGLHNVELIVSNPPYIPFEEAPALDKRVTQFEPHIALFTKNHRLEFYYKLIELFEKQENPKCEMWLETHQDYAEEVELLFGTTAKAQKILDFSGNPRFIYAAYSGKRM